MLHRLSQAQLRLSKIRGAGACDTCCNRTVVGQEWMNDCVDSLKKLKLKYWTLPCQERFKFGAGDPVACRTAYFIPVFFHGACAIMRVSVVPGKFMLLIGKDTLNVLDARLDLKHNIGIFPGAGDLQGKVLRESRAGHLMVPLLPDTSWEFHDSFVPPETAGRLVFSANVTNEVFSVKRLQGSRTIRDLMISSGKGSFQRLHRTFRGLRQKRTTASEQDSQVEEEVMENVVMDAERLPAPEATRVRRDGCRGTPAPEATRSLRYWRYCVYWLWVVWKHEVESREKRHSMFVAGWRSRLGITWCIPVDDSKRVLWNSGRSHGCRSGRWRRNSSFKKTNSGGTSSNARPAWCRARESWFRRERISSVRARILLWPRFLEIPRHSEEQEYAVDVQLWNPGFWTLETTCRTNRSENEFWLQFKESTTTFGFGISKSRVVAHSQLCQLSSSETADW